MNDMARHLLFAVLAVMFVVVASIAIGKAREGSPTACSSVPYDRSEWKYNAKELRRKLYLRSPWTAYTGVPFYSLPDGKEVEVDHLVALKEVHLRGGCFWSEERKSEFASNPDNTVLSIPVVNRTKGPNPGWFPHQVAGWFAMKRREILIREDLL